MPVDADRRYDVVEVLRVRLLAIGRPDLLGEVACILDVYPGITQHGEETRSTEGPWCLILIGGIAGRAGRYP